MFQNSTNIKGKFNYRFLKKIFGIQIINIIAVILLYTSCVKNNLPEVVTLASFEEAMNSKYDLWGEAAMAQPDGASYEFFEPLLPPPRYVNADFHYYPIVLSAPNSKVKARLISNGSGINIKGGAKSWRDAGTPFTFRVGPDEFLFGSLSDRLSEPILAEGWLPITEICYSHKTPFQSEGIVPLDHKRKVSPPEIYRLEAFASTDSILAMKGVVLVKFDLKQGSNGYIAVEVDSKSTYTLKKGKLIDKKGHVLALFDEMWTQDDNLIKARLQKGDNATIVIPTVPFGLETLSEFNKDTYKIQRESCIRTWKTLLSKGMKIVTPELLINNAYRNSICQIFQLINGNTINYSAGNQYEKLYAAEGSDAALSLLKCGYESDMHKQMIPLFEFTRKGLELHQAGFKINNLCQYYWQSRDNKVIEELRSLWENEVQLLDKNRTGANGLYPSEQYCGDIHKFVQSLNVNTKAWRAMRDLGALLSKTGYKDESEHYLKEAATFRQVVINAINEVVRHETNPPFIPIALNGGEPIHDPILHSRIGSYWNIIIGYTIGSGIFPIGSDEENWIPHYQEQHGGLCMGMVKSGGGQWNFWTGDHRVNPLYSTRYTLDALRRDDPERALVSLYGMLAQGLTRNTFIGGEGSSLQPVDDNGRFFYCPPNSAASAFVLSMIRNLLIQDWDLDDDGIPETLRLGFATPRQWLEDSKTIEVMDAPTAFGLTSFTVKSDLKAGEVVLNFTPPPRSPNKVLIRVRVPNTWQVKSATINLKPIHVDEKGTVDVSSIAETSSIHFKVEKI